jgi:hypothetical protein
MDPVGLYVNMVKSRPKHASKNDSALVSVAIIASISRYGFSCESFHSVIHNDRLSLALSFEATTVCVALT